MSNFEDMPNAPVPALPNQVLCSNCRDALILTALWLGCLLVDSLWISQHHLPPAWDQGDHLSRALGFWQVLQQPFPWNGDWWVALWNQSPSYRGPLTYLVTASIFGLLEPSYGAAILSNSLFNGLLLASVYGLGRLAHSRSAGRWATLFVSCAPALLNQRSDYLIDFSLTAVITACWLLFGVAVLTRSRRRWLWAMACGLGLGLVILTRPTGVVLLWVPLLALVWTATSALLAPPLIAPGRRGPRRLDPLGRCALALAMAAMISGPWFIQNWLTIFSTINKAINWGVAYQDGLGANSLGGWLYYPQILPTMLGQTLVATVIAGALLALITAWRQGWRPRSSPSSAQCQDLLWWLSFPLGGLLACILMTSKDFRFVLPLLPQFAVVLGVVTAQTAAQERPWIRPWQIALSALALSGLLSNHFALGSNLTGFVSHPPQRERGWPVEAIIATIHSQSPYQLSTLAVMPDSEFLNAFNLDAEGRRQQFKVAARQTLAPLERIEDDLAGFDWFLLKGGNQGVMSDECQARLTQLVAQSTTFWKVGQWPLPDGSRADLYRRRQLSLELYPIVSTAGTIPSLSASLQALEPEHIEQPLAAAGRAFRPGERLQLEVVLQGPIQQLATGLLLLDWQLLSASDPSMSTTAEPRLGDHAGSRAADSSPWSENDVGPSRWRADHAIGQGMLRVLHLGDFRIHEHLALQLPAKLAPGSYQLHAQLLSPTGQVQPLSVSASRVLVQSSTLEAHEPHEAPTLTANRIAVLRQMGKHLRAGQLETLFALVGQLNQTDPDQVYLRDGAAISSARLREDPRNLDDLYALALAQALQRQADDAANTLTRILELDPDNPYTLMGLGIVNLYRFKPSAARPLLERAAQLEPNNDALRTLRTVRIVADAMGLDWRRLLSLIRQSEASVRGLP